MKKIIYLMLFTFSFQPLFACDFCMLGQGVSPYLIGNDSGVTLESTYTQSNNVYDRKSRISGNGKTESWTLYSLTGFYTITNDWSVMFTVPYYSKSNIDFDSTSNSNPGVIVSDFGDMSLTGRYTLYNSHSNVGTAIAGLLFGVKLPTGSTNKLDMQGNPVDRHALPGTGSVDWNLGFTSVFTGDGFQGTFDAVYSLAGKGKWNHRDHQYGNTLNSSLKGYIKTSHADVAQHAFYVFTGPSLEVTDKEKGTQTDIDYEPTQINPSTGGTVGYWNLGFYGVFQSTTMINLGLAKSVYHHMNFDSNFDADPAENYKINLSVSFLL